MKKVIASIMCICMLALILTGCSPSKPDNIVKKSKEVSSEAKGSAEEKTDKKPQPVIEKTDGDFPYEVHDSLDKELFIIFTNASATQKEVELEATFYKGDSILSTDKILIRSIGAKKTSCCTLSKPEDTDNNVVEYDRIELDIKGETNKSYEDCIESISIEHNKGAKDIMIKATNNSDEKVRFIYCYASFYKDGVIIGASHVSVTSLEAGSSKTATCNTPRGSDYRPIEYDKYEVMISSAYN